MHDAKLQPQVNNITNEKGIPQIHYIENNLMEYPQE